MWLKINEEGYEMKRIIVAVTGASGTIYAIELLKALQKIDDVETHLVMSKWGKQNLELETYYSLDQMEGLADHVYRNQDLGAAIASGSFLTDAMVIVPASMKSIASIATGLADNLVARAADVILKEQRQLIIVPRETPFSLIHLKNMTKLAKMGVQIIPPIPAFYHRPKTVEELVNHQTMKLLDALHLANRVEQRWSGIGDERRG
ncbi:3-polyprenyl-4-hydroxybenzoate carboxy-lyase UbiX [Paucilactobacillus wasatchensis]|uniref:Flavin prenyltransferase UbiX n=2 Tax=Paucilactobacillus wasatchensis TaxID=1335616 RepID=A0A0D0YUD2_9LACO|nr:3-polyprenyl-4-hydroxybenzoate carboxy-lyase UbiX [Paucilactobacillus wasatchensis]